jgi:hypothetical protein
LDTPDYFDQPARISQINIDRSEIFPRHRLCSMHRPWHNHLKIGFPRVVQFEASSIKTLATAPRLAPATTHRVECAVDPEMVKIH